jgi:DNA-binding XRE family transcriptional regulator
VTGRDNKKLRKWSPGERLWLWRRQLGITQETAAAMLGLTTKKYWEMELDLTRYVTKLPSLYKMAPGDLCALARRRHGLGLRDTAKLFGISHTELLRRERHSDPRLIREWERHGYR